MLNLLNKEEEEPLYFEFRFVPREDDDQNLYHARVRLGSRSDFSTMMYILKARKIQQAGSVFLMGSGYHSGRRCSGRIQGQIRPEIENVKFGFLYWDAAAYNPKWAYGMNSEHKANHSH